MKSIKGVACSLASVALASFAAAHPASAQVLLSDTFTSENSGVGQLNYTGFANFNAIPKQVRLQTQNRLIVARSHLPHSDVLQGDTHATAGRNPAQSHRPAETRTHPRSSEMEMFDMRSDNRMQNDRQFFPTYCRVCRREIPANETVCAYCGSPVITDHSAHKIEHPDFNKQAAGVGKRLWIHPIDVIMLIAMAAYVFRLGYVSYSLISFLVVVLHGSIISSFLSSSLMVAVFLVTFVVYCLVALDVFSDNNSFKKFAYSVCGFNAFGDVLSLIKHGASFMMFLPVMWLVVDVVIALCLWRKYRTRTLY